MSNAKPTRSLWIFATLATLGIFLEGALLGHYLGVWCILVCIPLGYAEGWFITRWLFRSRPY